MARSKVEDTVGEAATRARAGRKIQKKMPVIWDDGSVSRPSARGSRAVQPPIQYGPVTSRLPLSRATGGLTDVATTAMGEFWEKFHHYHRLQAELEKLYLWFEDFEQKLSRDNHELDRILSGVQALYRPTVGAPRTDAADPKEASAESETVPASSR